MTTMRISNVLTIACVTLLLATLVACDYDMGVRGTTPISVAHVQGRITDVETGEGIEGVAVTLAYSAGAFGSGTTNSDSTDVEGRFDLVVDFIERSGSPALCTPVTFAIGVYLPAEYELIPPNPAADRFIECTEEVQIREIYLRRIGG